MVGGSLPSTPASSTTRTGRHNIAEILLKVSLKHQKSKSIAFIIHVNMKQTRWAGMFYG